MVVTTRTIERIRRTEMPQFASHEAACRERYPRAIELPGFELRYRVHEYDVGEICDAVRKRECFCWIKAGRRRVGAMKLNAYDPDGCAGNRDFLEIMDRDAEIEYRLAGVLCSGWSDVTEITPYGSILHFESAWIAPEYSRGSLFADAAHAIIDKEFQEHSVLIMLAFPLEHEGKDGPLFERGFGYRQRAMIRHYRRIFGVEPFPGHRGREGWLWRIGRAQEFVPPPKGAAIPRPTRDRRDDIGFRARGTMIAGGPPHAVTCWKKHPHSKS